MLGTLPPNKKSSWRDMVLMLLHVYNCQNADMNAAMNTKFVQQFCERLKWA